MRTSVFLRRPIALAMICLLLMMVFNSQGATVQSVLSENISMNSVVAGPDGALYGTTYYGGDNDLGTVFKWTSGGGKEVIYSFGGLDGAYPKAGLFLFNGNLYGTTQFGGNQNVGTVFQMTSSGTLTLLHSLGGGEGEEPLASLVAGSDGNLYGTASRGGTGFGTIFQITTNGNFTNLFQFSGNDGDSPSAALTVGLDGLLYGTTAFGGINNYGTIFKMTTGGVFTSLLSFDGSNGATPQAALVQSSNGTFFGTTTYGGVNGFGTVFKIQPDGTFNSLNSLTTDTGSNPESGLILVNGDFYGVGKYGGINGFGSVFQGTTGGVVTIQYEFMGDFDGGYPTTSFGLGNDSAYYATTDTGGAADGGTLYSLLIAPSVVISDQPVSITNHIGTTATFSVTATAVAPLTYVWQKDGTNLTETSRISGVTNSTLFVRVVTPADEGLYSVFVSDNSTLVQSASASLTVIERHPVFGSMQLSPDGQQVQYAGSAGATNGQYTILMTDNLGTPMANWTPVATNQFDASGGFSFGFALDTNAPQRFFLLKLP